MRVPTTPQSDYEGYRSSLTFTVKKGWLILIPPKTKKNVYVVEWVACDILGPGWSLVKFLCPGRHDPDFWHILQCPEYFLLSWIGAWKHIVLDLYLGDHMHQIWLHLFIRSGLMDLYLLGSEWDDSIRLYTLSNNHFNNFEFINIRFENKLKINVSKRFYTFWNALKRFFSKYQNWK